MIRFHNNHSTKGQEDVLNTLVVGRWEKTWVYDTVRGTKMEN